MSEISEKLRDVIPYLLIILAIAILFFTFAPVMSGLYGNWQNLPQWTGSNCDLLLEVNLFIDAFVSSSSAPTKAKDTLEFMGRESNREFNDWLADWITTAHMLVAWDAWRNGNDIDEIFTGEGCDNE